MKNTKTILYLLCLLFSMSVWGQKSNEKGQKTDVVRKKTDYYEEVNRLFKQGKYDSIENKIKLWLLDTAISDKTFGYILIQKAKDCMAWREDGRNCIRNRDWINAFIHFNNIVNANPYDKNAKGTLNLCIRKLDTLYIKKFDKLDTMSLYTKSLDSLIRKRNTQKTVVQKTDDGCSTNTFKFDSAKPKTTKEWPVGNQVWSDVVVVNKCKKEIYDGGSLGRYNADCRENEPDTAGILFSWCAVKRFDKQLCPAPWRVPTKEDFFTLDTTLGGDGKGKATKKIAGKNELLAKYRSWGGVHSSYSDASGTLYQSSYVYYWSQSMGNSTSGFTSRFSDTVAVVTPQGYNFKSLGFTLRCVKDKK